MTRIKRNLQEIEHPELNTLVMILPEVLEKLNQYSKDLDKSIAIYNRKTPTRVINDADLDEKIRPLNALCENLKEQLEKLKGQQAAIDSKLDKLSSLPDSAEKITSKLDKQQEWLEDSLLYAKVRKWWKGLWSTQTKEETL